MTTQIGSAQDGIIIGTNIAINTTGNFSTSAIDTTIASTGDFATSTAGDTQLVSTGEFSSTAYKITLTEKQSVSTSGITIENTEFIFNNISKIDGIPYPDPTDENQLANVKYVDRLISERVFLYYDTNNTATVSRIGNTTPIQYGLFGSKQLKNKYHNSTFSSKSQLTTDMGDSTILTPTFANLKIKSGVVAGSVFKVFVSIMYRRKLDTSYDVAFTYTDTNAINTTYHFPRSLQTSDQNEFRTMFYLVVGTNLTADYTLQPTLEIKSSTDNLAQNLEIGKWFISMEQMESME